MFTKYLTYVFEFCSFVGVKQQLKFYFLFLIEWELCYDNYSKIHDFGHVIENAYVTMKC